MKESAIFNIILYNLRNFFRFSGRAGRLEYFVISCIQPTIFIVCFAIILMFGSLINTIIVFYVLGVLFVVSWLILFVQLISIAIRRFHDLNLSGWWFLLLLVPIINFILGLVLWFKKSSAESKYGPSANIYKFNKIDYIIILIVGVVILLSLFMGDYSYTVTL